MVGDGLLFITFIFFFLPLLTLPYFFLPGEKVAFCCMKYYLLSCFLILVFCFKDYFVFMWQGKEEAARQIDVTIFYFSLVALSNNTDSFFSWRSGLQTFLMLSILSLVLWGSHTVVDTGSNFSVLCHLIYRYRVEEQSSVNSVL